MCQAPVLLHPRMKCPARGNPGLWCLCARLDVFKVSWCLLVCFVVLSSSSQECLGLFHPWAGLGLARFQSCFATCFVRARATKILFVICGAFRYWVNLNMCKQDVEHVLLIGASAFSPGVLPTTKKKHNHHITWVGLKKQITCIQHALAFLGVQKCCLSHSFQVKMCCVSERVQDNMTIFNHQHIWSQHNRKINATDITKTCILNPKPT